MPIQIVRNDITKMKVDAIVNTANKDLMPGGGVNGAIHKVAGPQLTGECKLLGGCKPGEAKLTYGYNLPSKYVIHTVGPVWQGGKHQEKEILVSCYTHALSLAKEKGCESLAFPLIAAGTFGYPKKQALKIAMDTIGDFLLDHDMMVYVCVFNKECLNISKALFANVEEYIDEHYVEEYENAPYYRSSMQREREIKAHLELPQFLKKKSKGTKSSTIQATPKALSIMDEDTGLDDWLNAADESFSEMVLRKIEEKGMTNAECYKKANIDKKLFSKIRSTPSYTPRKGNCLALAIALQLSLYDTEKLLNAAEFTLSRSSKRDLAIIWHIQNRIYDIHTINIHLNMKGLPLLGSSGRD